MVDANPSEFRAQRINMALVSTFVAALTLSLATMHSEQPVSFTMDMVSFGFHDGEVPALASIQFEEAARQDLLLVHLHTRVPMGMGGLWIAMILAALLLVVPLLRNIGTQPWVKFGVWLPPTLVLSALVLWIVSVQSTFSQADFANYLTEFDLATIASITYPQETWSISTPWVVVIPVGVILLHSYYFLTGGTVVSSVEANKSLSETLNSKVSIKSFLEKGSMAHPSFSRVSCLGLLVIAIVRISFPDSTPVAQQWAAILCLGFALISLIEQRGVLKVWSALCCLIVALMGFMVGV
jgi:hypothetical protein